MPIPLLITKGRREQNMLRLLLCLLTVSFGKHSEANNSQEDQVWSVTGVAGRSCELPCFMNPRTPGDRPKLILWYKSGVRSPIFSYDGRDPQVEDDIRAEEGELTVTRTTATLTLLRITLTHAGLYECRVEFFHSPTHTSLVNLTIVAMPRSMEVTDSKLGPPKKGILGPYREGVMVILTCLARDGWPVPNVTWWRGTKMLDSAWEMSGPGLVRNDLVLARLSRDWHNDTLKCTSTNTDLVPPMSISVTIHMYLLPTSVVITGPTSAREGSQLRLRCSSRGSRPSAQLTWLMRGAAMPAEKENTVYGHVTSSTIIINVTRKDDGSQVACKATNPATPGTSITNTTVLTVHYPPTVEASLGRSLRPSLLKERDDVYFTCEVDANPPVDSITWYHEGRIQVQNVSAGIILSGKSLVMQKVERRRAGRYRCVASNSLATVTSNSVMLRIRYAPECITSPTAYFIYDKPINVSCAVSAYPPPTAIHWQWNSSAEEVLSQPVLQMHDQAAAHLTVFPDPDQEDRALSCWAVNEMGMQLKPCGFSVKVAKTPLPLSSCRLANITASSLSLACQRPDTPIAGTTLYRAEVYFENETLFANVTSPRPNFNVSRLDADTSYRIKVYVTHGPVTSQPVVVSAYTSRSSRKQTEKNPETRTSKVGGVVGGIVVTVIILVGGIWARHYFAHKWRRSRRKEETRPPSDDSNPDVVPNIADETYDLLSLEESKSEDSQYRVLDGPVHHTVAAQPQAVGSSSEAYQPLVLKASVKEGQDSPHEVRSSTYCPVKQSADVDEIMV